MNVIGTLVKKDLKLFFKNRFFSLITFLGIIFYIVLFFILPSSVNENLELVIYSEKPLSRINYFLKEEKVRFKYVNSVEEIKEAILNNRANFGISFLGDLKSVRVYFSASSEKFMREAYRYIAKELVYVELGDVLNVESKEVVLGEDMIGKQIPLRRRLIPVLLFLLIMTESLGLSTLIAEEVEEKTIFAVLSTPATISDVFVEKTIVGLILTLIPSLLFLVITLGVGKSFPLLFLLLVLGSLLSISIGFLIGSVARDFMGVVAIGGALFLVLLFPLFNILSPGIFTGWIKIIPSYFFSDTLHRIINFSASFGDVYRYTLILILTDTILFFAGGFFLKRRLV